MNHTFLNILTMPLPELEVHLRQRRKERFDRGIRPRHIRLRQCFYPAFKTFLFLDRMTRKQTVTVLNPPPKLKGPTIYACSHIWQNDLENIYEHLGRNCWWFLGDPGFLYREISGLLIYLNGSVFLDTGDKTDRNLAYQRSVHLLHSGGSLMIFPEGARNGSENQPIMPLYPGSAGMAMETGAPIVPTAIEEFSGKFYLSFGTPMDPRDFQDRTDMTQALRDAMCTLKWNIWETQGIQSRSSLPSDYGQKFRAEFERKLHPYDTPETVERTRFHTREEVEQQNSFNHLSCLIPSKNNAFLLRKH